MAGKSDSFDVVILGGGNAGYAAAFRAAGLGLSVALAMSGAWGQDYPNRPVRILVPNAPGSSVDTMTRILTAKLGEPMGGVRGGWAARGWAAGSAGGRRVDRGRPGA